MQTTTMVLLSQLVGLAPILIVYVGGMVLAAVWWGRGPRAAALAMAGLALSLIATLGVTIAQSWAIGNRGTTPTTSLAYTMSMIGIGSSLLRAAGLALVIAGVFAGRPRPAGRAFEVVGNRMSEER